MIFLLTRGPPSGGWWHLPKYRVGGEAMIPPADADLQEKDLPVPIQGREVCSLMGILLLCLSPQLHTGLSSGPYLYLKLLGIHQGL